MLATSCAQAVNGLIRKRALEREREREREKTAEKKKQKKRKRSSMFFWDELEVFKRGKRVCEPQYTRALVDAQPPFNFQCQPPCLSPKPLMLQANSK